MVKEDAEAEEGQASQKWRRSHETGECGGVEFSTSEWRGFQCFTIR